MALNNHAFGLKLLNKLATVILILQAIGQNAAKNGLLQFWNVGICRKLFRSTLLNMMSLAISKSVGGNFKVLTVCDSV